MPSAFNVDEIKTIRKALKQSALRHASTTGMKNVTVEDLTREAGISKGAFYHFYENKELLFLDMMEEFCQCLTEKLTELAKTLQGLSPEGLSEQLLLEGLHSIMDPAFSRFFCEDVPCLLRKLSPEEKAAHFASVDEYLRKLIRGADIRLRVSEPVAISAIKLLVACAAHSSGHDACSRDAVNILAESLCKNLVTG